jgi:hypothetical protein
MGLRFRQRIKLAPGINLNLGLGGASLSLGGRGASLNIGRKGVRGTVGAPGTGLSYSEQLYSFSKDSRPATRNSSTSALANLKGFRLSLSDDDEVRAELDLGDGYQGVFANAKQWSLIKGDYEVRIKQWLDEEASNRNRAVYSLSQLHHDLAEPGSRFNPLKPFDEQPPRLVLPEPLGMLEKLNPFAQKRFDEATRQAHERYQLALSEFHECRSQYERYCKLALDQQRKAQVGNVEAMTALLSDCFSRIDWPNETLIDFEFVNDAVLCVDVDFPELEELHQVVYSTQSNLNGLFRKKLKSSELHQLYFLHIHGIVARLVAEAFSILPTLDSVVISGYTQRRDRAGQAQDDYVLSLGIDKATWGQIFRQAMLDPEVIMDTPCSRVKRLSNHKLGSITPFEISDFSFS